MLLTLLLIYDWKPDNTMRETEQAAKTANPCIANVAAINAPLFLILANSHEIRATVAWFAPNPIPNIILQSINIATTDIPLGVLDEKH